VIRASFGKTTVGRLLLGAGVLALTVPAVAGCEATADAPTQQFHQAASGAQALTPDGIRITNAFVLGGPSGTDLTSGSSASLFVSLYNGGSSGDQLESISAPGWASSVSLSNGMVSLPANSAPANLTGPQPEIVLENLSKPLRSGSTIPVTFTFAQAGPVHLQVPVEPQSFQWATFSPAPSPSPTATATASPTATGTGSPTATGTGSPTATASPSPSK
jgi:copper(I)-binding protein